jgi:hypothetical protein
MGRAGVRILGGGGRRTGPLPNTSTAAWRALFATLRRAPNIQRLPYRPGQRNHGPCLSSRQKITFAEMRATGVRGLLICCSDYPGLGSVENQDSLCGLVVIQALDGTIRTDRRPMGEDGTALSG